jgi:hypothetical protein
VLQQAPTLETLMMPWPPQRSGRGRGVHRLPHLGSRPPREAVQTAGVGDPPTPPRHHRHRRRCAC